MKSTLTQALFEIQPLKKLSKKQSTGLNQSSNGASSPGKDLAGANTPEILHTTKNGVHKETI